MRLLVCHIQDTALFSQGVVQDEVKTGFCPKGAPCLGGGHHTARQNAQDPNWKREGFREWEDGAAKRFMPARRAQGKLMEEVVLSWLFVNRKDGGKFIFTSGRIGICEVQRFEKCWSFLE